MQSFCNTSGALKKLHRDCFRLPYVKAQHAKISFKCLLNEYPSNPVAKTNESHNCFFLDESRSKNVYKVSCWSTSRLYIPFQKIKTNLLPSQCPSLLLLLLLRVYNPRPSFSQECFLTDKDKHFIQNIKAHPRKPQKRPNPNIQPVPFRICCTVSLPICAAVKPCRDTTAGSAP